MRLAGFCLTRCLRNLRSLYSLMSNNTSTPSKLLVRHIAMGKFLGPAGRWVKKAESALNFPNLLSVINTCLSRRLKDVELILRYDDQTPERRFPLNAIQ